MSSPVGFRESSRHSPYLSGCRVEASDLARLFPSTMTELFLYKASLNNIIHLINPVCGLTIILCQLLTYNLRCLFAVPISLPTHQGLHKSHGVIGEASDAKAHDRGRHLQLQNGSLSTLKVLIRDYNRQIKMLKKSTYKKNC